MKKQFFYAAFAIAMMASCTSENEPVVDQPTPDAEDKVAIELSVNTPTMTAGSRAIEAGTGTVGSVENETTGISWNSQELFVTMVEKGETTQVTENGEYIFEGLKFRAPSAAEALAGNNDIRIYTTYDETTDKGTLQYRYYPIVGKFDFYGWHVDNAATDGGTLNDLTVSDIQIDGTQDILAAKTLAITTENGYSAEEVALANEAFSAKSARNNVKPKLQFNHALARLKFYVRSGVGSDAAINYKDKDGNEQERTNLLIPNTGHNDSQYSAYSTGAIYVTDIQVKEMYQDITLDLSTQKATAAANSATPNFILRSADDSHLTGGVGDADKKLEELIPVAPEYAYGHPENPNGEKATPIGDAIMFLPEGTAASSIKIQVQLGQCLIDTEDETTDPHTFTYYWDTPDPVTLTLDATSITNPSASNSTNTPLKFLAGESYNVYITIYGRERIEISAQLTEWKDGGDIETDIENGYEENNTQTGGSTTNP